MAKMLGIPTADVIAYAKKVEKITDKLLELDSIPIVEASKSNPARDAAMQQQLPPTRRWHVATQEAALKDMLMMNEWVLLPIYVHEAMERELLGHSSHAKALTLDELCAL